ncbi:MAG: hypothetical protein BECKG1743D_GA0114223_100535 [Candidatus Kentron sp. G]|nr:MAG: hypothetical protein BECKG1743D_GA0114223_100535 [Candidatus Kentron sp. G]VFM99675.1 MAG: hypothetical protein BECKG1743E_GA0114224_102734 [Candidatus Kentron sp. G]VFN01538.1 MAG: hypothetical protein BECKG1743F_GA0114225_105892 [Candidatus Kentron sp. G]
MEHNPTFAFTSCYWSFYKLGDSPRPRDFFTASDTIRTTGNRTGREVGRWLHLVCCCMNSPDYAYTNNVDNDVNLYLMIRSFREAVLQIYTA